jgi:hypothetical protein
MASVLVIAQESGFLFISSLKFLPLGLIVPFVNLCIKRLSKVHFSFSKFQLVNSLKTDKKLFVTFF